MSIDKSPISLFDNEQERVVDAELWDGITKENLEHWKKYWKPHITDLLGVLKSNGVDSTLWPQSSHWNWEGKLNDIHGNLGSRCLSIVCDGSTEAMMILDLTHRARLACQKHQHLVYVDYLETAPWNIGRKHIANARYSGCGSILISAAIQLSIDEGFQGRIGLHSLTQAIGFYSGLGMIDLGRDEKYESLRYFETTPEIAQRLIMEGNHEV